MADWRRIDSAILHHPVLTKLPATGRYLWVGMILAADPKTGCLPSDEGWLRRRILPNTRGMGASLRHYTDTLEAHCMLVRDILDGVNVYRITNYYLYQQTDRQYKQTDRQRSGKTAAPSPPRKAPPDADPEPSSAMQSASDFLDAELCPPAYQLPKLLDDLKRTGHTIDDVQVWRECLEWLRQHGTLKDPRSFVRSRFPKFRTPADAGIDWGDDAEPESGAPPPPTAEELERSDLLELCYANRRKIAATLGAPWDGADSGLTTTKGTYLWQDLKLTQLKHLAKKLGLNGNTQSL